MMRGGIKKSTKFWAWTSSLTTFDPLAWSLITFLTHPNRCFPLWDHPDLFFTQTLQNIFLRTTPSGVTAGHTIFRWLLTHPCAWQTLDIVYVVVEQMFLMTVSDILLYYLMFAVAHPCCASSSSFWWFSKIRKSIVGCVVGPWPLLLRTCG